MQRVIVLFAAALSITPHTGLSQEANTKSLIAGMRPEVQEQIDKVYNFYRVAAFDDLKNPCDALEEIQRLRDIADDKGEIVEQLAIFVAINESEEDLHSMAAGDILKRLSLPASIPIRVLAPYLDSENEKLRRFAHGWFHNHDSYDRVHGRPPLGSVNYYDYAQYVRSRLEKNEEIPTAFTRYIYEKYPGKALLVFTYSSYIDFNPEHRHRELRRQMELSDRIISNAVWLHEHDFAERFQAALPEVMTEIEKLAKHDEWWARLYVAYIMRENPELHSEKLIQLLSEDKNQLVREVASNPKTSNH